MLRIISAAALALLFTFLHSLPAAAAAQLLQDIRFESISPNEERIIFRLTGSEMPKFFPIREGKPRLVFDFSDTGVSKRIRNSVDINGKLVERVRVGLHESKTRVVLDLVEGRHVQTIQEPDQEHHLLTVIVHDAGIKPLPRPAPPVVSSSKPPKKQVQPPVRQPAVKTVPPPAVSAPPQEKTVQSSRPATSFNGSSTVLTTVLFDKNSNRGEMVMFRLNKFHPPVVFGLEENKPRVVCDFQDTVAGERLAETVPADGKFVRSIRINNNPAEQKIRVVLDLMPNKSYDLQQVFFKNDNLFVLIINTLGSAAKHLN
ncbi:AMIN domain-containing protein [Candidatus Electronema halotolerans]